MLLICAYFCLAAMAVLFQVFLLVKRFSDRIGFLTLSGDVSLFCFPHPRGVIG